MYCTICIHNDSEISFYNNLNYKLLIQSCKNIQKYVKILAVPIYIFSDEGRESNILKFWFHCL